MTNFFILTNISFIRYILLPVFLIIMPVALGLLPVRFMQKRHQSLRMVWICGHLIMWGIFQIMSVPLIVNERPFSVLSTRYTFVITVVSVFSAVFCKNLFSDAVKESRNHLPGKEHTGPFLIALLLIIIQLIGVFIFSYPDGDSAFYLGTSLTTLHTDSMYIYDPYTGSHGFLDIRHALSPMPIFVSWLSDLTNIHAAVLCHLVLSSLFIILMYVIYMEIGDMLFPEQKRNSMIFMIFLNMWYIFGNISIYTPESFAITRTYQGKSMFANLIIPLMFLLLLYIIKNEMQLGEWILLFLVSICGVFTTTIAVFIIPVFMAGCGIAISIRDKNPLCAAKIFPCLSPCAFYGLLYLFMR